MSSYISSKATKSITVVPYEYPTTITLEAPSEVRAGEDFTVSGTLTYTKEGGAYPLMGRTINLSYNTASLGSATTGADGGFSKKVNIPTVGSYVLAAEFMKEQYYAQAKATLFITTGRFPALRTFFPRLFEILDRLRGEVP